MTRIKFCGMTRHEDVEAAVALGVDAIGFVLWPGSPRAVSMAALRDLVKRIPDDILPVGVFVRPGERDVEAARDAGIRAIQLHGVDGRPAWLADIDVWIAASLTDDGYSPAIGDDCLLLLDAHDPERHGGTGVPIDWTRAARVAAARRIMLAGGLRPATVGEAIRAVRPYGVDVASGIEVRPGVKDPDAMRAFVARVRQDPS